MIVWSYTTRGTHRHAFVAGSGKSICGGQERLAITTRNAGPDCPQCTRLVAQLEGKRVAP